MDSGVGWGNSEVDAAYQPRRRSLSEALRLHGLEPDDVALVVNTHLHFDHCGANHLLAGRPIYVQADEYEAAHTRPHYTILEWVDFPGARYEQLRGEHELLAGVTLLPTPGHTPGHQSVTIETHVGLVILAGQAIYSVAEYEQMRTTGSLAAAGTGTQEQSSLSARRLVALEPRYVLFSHDHSRWSG